MMFLKRKLVSVLFVFVATAFFSQSVVDSLRRKLSEQKREDTTKALLLADLAFEYSYINSDTALLLADKAIALSKKLNYTNGYVAGKNVYALVYRDNGKMKEAIAIYDELITIRKKENREDKLISLYGNVGGVYLVDRNYPKAIKNLDYAFDLSVKLKRKEVQLTVLGNLALAYQDMGDLDKALSLLNLALQLNKEVKDEIAEANILNNTALIYQEKGNLEGAAANLKRGKEIFKKYEYYKGVLDNSINLANNYNRQGKFEEALNECAEAELLCAEFGDSLYMANLYIARSNALGALNRVSEIEPLLKYALAAALSKNDEKLQSVTLLVYADFYKAKFRYDSAISCTQRALLLARQIGDSKDILGAYENLYELYNQKKDGAKALFYLERVVEIKDSLSTDDFNTKVANMKTLFDLDQKDNEIALLTRDGLIEKEQVARQRVVLIYAAAGGVLLLAFLFLAWRAYRRKKRDAIILENQKQEIELKSVMLSEKNEQILQQKDLIEEKNKEMMDSINYAKRIQSSLLASHTLLSKNLPEYFVFYKPKDIVSGDFYWATELRKLRPGKMFQEKGAEVKGINEASEFILAVGDCTGHGVPGAFMSLLNISKLSETINEKKINKPGLILDAVRKEIIHVLNPPTSEFFLQEEVKDGMDCVLLRIDLETLTLSYAAANNPIYVLRNGKINICPPDKMPVGKSPREHVPFSTYTVPLQKGDCIYVMTDGYADQFGGPKGKKFKHKSLQELLLKYESVSMSDQQKAVESAFVNWKGLMDQVDDVCIIGIRI